MFGSVGFDTANNNVSHFETITLNDTAIAALNAAAGNSFLFGGSVNTVGTDRDAIFGGTRGTPVAFLTLVPGVSAVPEPASWAMMIIGFGMVGGMARYRRQRTVVRFA